jgi:cytochrome b561
LAGAWPIRRRRGRSKWGRWSGRQRAVPDLLVRSLASDRAPDESVAAAAKLAHLGLFVALAALLVVHIGAALRHHFFVRDEVLTRMLFGRGGSG